MNDAVNIDEPQRIFLWGTELDGGLGKTVPRAYEVAYSKKLHERVDVAARKLRKGIPVIGEIDVGATTVDTESGEIVRSTKNNTDIVFFDAPEALIPRKQ